MKESHKNQHDEEAQVSIPRKFERKFQKRKLKSFNKKLKESHKNQHDEEAQVSIPRKFL